VPRLGRSGSTELAEVLALPPALRPHMLPVSEASRFALFGPEQTETVRLPQRWV